MNISDIDLFRVQVPGTQDIHDSSLVVHLTTESGIEGWGETKTRWRFEEAAAWQSVLLHCLVGRRVFDVEETVRLDALDQASLASAVEMACWDIIGRLAEQPICHLWGGMFRSHVPLTARLPDGTIEQCVAVARELAEKGFRRQMISSTHDVGETIQRIQAVRETVGEHVSLQLDGQQRYSLLEARQLANGLQGEEAELFLDPLSTQDYASVASLTQQVDVPLGLSRGIRGADDVMLASRAGISATVLASHRVGGFSMARRCVAVAETAGISVSLDGFPSVGIASAAAAQFSAAIPAMSSGNQFYDHSLADDVLFDSLSLVDGMIMVSQLPGIGVEVDRKKIEHYRLG